MKATLFLTMSCNLSCDYCYISKQNKDMNRDTLTKAIDFIFRKADSKERLDFGFFGGEPLLNWALLQEAVDLIEEKSENCSNDVRISLVTNGTLLNREILNYLKEHNIILQISCDGIPYVQDMFRKYADGSLSSSIVERNLIAAIETLPAVLVNMVYGPETYSYLTESLDYFNSLGLKQIVLNPDYSAPWNAYDIKGLKLIYKKIGAIYLKNYESDNPIFISLIDEKIAVILRGGYNTSEHCHMGYKEFAFSPDCLIFPCERLVGNGEDSEHCIGHLDQPEKLNRSHCPEIGKTCKSVECQLCGISDFCMNWCGCSNFLATGSYHHPSPFICASERLAIETAFEVLNSVEEENQLIFMNHYAGLPMVNSST